MVMSLAASTMSAPREPNKRKRTIMTLSASRPNVDEPPPTEEAGLSQWTSAPETTKPIQRLDARHTDAAAATLAQAFFDDPLLQIVLADKATRQRWAPWFMSLPVRYGLRWGEVWGTDDTSAVAVWVPPGRGDMSLGRMLRLGLAKMPFRLGIAGTRRFIQALSATEPFHKAIHGAHWYLVAVGTHTECQGQGIGSALVELGTSAADAAGVPCYLETGTQSNIDFYTKRGFEIVGQTELDGHTLTGMVRHPNARSIP
jgi:ribosomal protein S18 acetylase RimI-like enzyme